MEVIIIISSHKLVFIKCCVSVSQRNVMHSHECCSNEKQVSSRMLKIFHLHSAKREHQI